MRRHAIRGGLPATVRTMSDSQSSGGVATAEQLPRRVRARRHGSAARRAAAVRRAGTARAHGPLRFATGIVLVVALAAAGFGVEGYLKAAHSQAKVAALDANLASLQRRVDADERAAAGQRRQVRRFTARATAGQRSLAQSLKRLDWQLQSVPSEGQLAGMRNQLAAYAACVPQLRNEIDGLGINWRIDSSKPSADYFKLVTATPTSASCGATLAGG